MKSSFLLPLFFLFPCFIWAKSIAIFAPPTDWRGAKPKNLSEHIEIGFVKKGSADFLSSMTIATETVDCSLKDYVKAVKEIHLAEPGTSWRDLQSLQMEAGKGHLIEISHDSPWGKLITLQAFFIQDSTAYILTAAALKEDFPSLQKEILSSFKSFHFEPDLYSRVQEPLHSKLKALFASIEQPISTEEKKKAKWQELQEVVEKETASLGAYWQFLALREGHAKIYSTLRSTP